MNKTNIIAYYRVTGISGIFIIDEGGAIYDSDGYWIRDIVLPPEDSIMIVDIQYAKKQIVPKIFEGCLREVFFHGIGPIFIKLLPLNLIKRPNKWIIGYSERIVLKYIEPDITYDYISELANNVSGKSIWETCKIQQRPDCDLLKPKLTFRFVGPGRY